MRNVSKTPPDYLQDSHLGKGTKEFLKVLNAAETPVEALPVPDARKVLVDAQASVKVNLSGIEESERMISAGENTIKLNIIRPEGKNGNLPFFVFIHGGGWVLGDYPTHKRLVRDLVVESGFPAIFVNYTPSPEAKYPQAVNEIYASVKWVSEHGEEININGKRMAIVGNSVGGNMAFVTCLKAREKHGPEIKAQILMWPVTDATFDWESYDLYGKQRFLTTPLMKWMFDQYTTDPEARKEIYLSPLQATVDQLRGLPPTLIEVAENDILRDQGEALGRKLDEAGVDVTVIRFNGVTHDWGMLNGFSGLPATRSLIVFTAAMLKEYLS
ncbi:alpha/beta hydrolase [Coprobacter tertius]|uniref:Alpha/beta hydrolase n=1 Tax=Coprobacter tertius TaxID=2944915 RepID=A0ABT1MK75_9BACT|nr:alpha/beta hydrolase [Coprobacter tertius]MCP9613033.1 alpha/beta hydrolase [Coprobacter tertius]